MHFFASCSSPLETQMLTRHWKARERHQSNIEHQSTLAMVETCRIVRTSCGVGPTMQNHHSGIVAKMKLLEFDRRRPKASPFLSSSTGMIRVSHSLFFPWFGVGRDRTHSKGHS